MCSLGHVVRIIYLVNSAFPVAKLFDLKGNLLSLELVMVES